MDFKFFEGLTNEEARGFLAAFLQSERAAIGDMLSAAEKEADIQGTFTTGSACAVLRWAIQKLRVIPKSPDPMLPAWIREGDAYASSLFGFDETSKIVTLRCAFYLGESFVRSYEELHWGIGDRETAVQNQPVVAGFVGGIEMSPMLVCQNVFLRVVVDGMALEEVDRTVAFWSARATSPPVAGTGSR